MPIEEWGTGRKSNSYTRIGKVEARIIGESGFSFNKKSLSFITIDFKNVWGPIVLSIQQE